MAELQSDEGRMMIDSVVWTQYVNVTDTQTDSHGKCRTTQFVYFSGENRNVRWKMFHNRTHGNSVAVVACNFHHIIIRKKRFIRDAVPTFVFATVNVAPRLQRLLHTQKDDFAYEIPKML